MTSADELLRRAAAENEAALDRLCLPAGGGTMSALNDDESAALAPWDSGSYSCACPADCPTLPCANDRDDLSHTVERILAGRLERLVDAANEAEIRWLIGEWLAEAGR